MKRRHARWLILSAVLLLAACTAGDGDGEGRGGGFLRGLFGYGFVLQILAVVHWARHGRDRMWIWIIFIGGAIGALAYFLIESDLSELRRTFAGPGRRRRITLLRALIRDNPSAGNYEELGELLVQQQKWAEARDAFDRAIAARSDLPDTFYWRGVAAFELGDDAAAIRDLEYVVRINPKFAYSRAQRLLAQALARAGRTDEARGAFDRLVQRSTSAEALATAAEFYAANGSPDTARALIEDLLARRVTMPAYQRRRDREWLRLAKKVARRLDKRAASGAPTTA